MRTLTQNLAQIDPQMILVGVDLAGKKNVAIPITTQAKRVGKVVFSHDAQGYGKLRHQLDVWWNQHQASGVLIGMEPTNHYWKLLAAELETHDIPYRLVNAYTVKKYREGGQLDRAKDDDRDAFFIADLLRTGKFTQTQRLAGSYAELREYHAGYVALRKEIARQKIRLRQMVAQTFPELGEVFTDLTGQTASALLSRHASAHHISHMSLETFQEEVRQDLKGSRLHLSKLSQAYQLAQNSVALKETKALEFVIGNTLATLTLQQSQLQALKEQMVEELIHLPEAPYLLSLNIGPFTTAQLVAEIGDPRSFSSAKQLVKLAGIQPTPNQSGRQTNGSTPISGKGRGRLRTALYFACLRLIQHDCAFKAYYHHLKQRLLNPLTGLQAIVVLMNKLLHIFWALRRSQSFYDPHKWRQATGI